MPVVRHLVCALVALALTAPLGGPPIPTPTPTPTPDPDSAHHRTAVLDRFEGDRAVLVVGDESLAVRATRLPAAGRHVDAVFAVRLAHGALTSVEYDLRATRRRARSARGRFDRLARAHPDGERSSPTTGSPTESAAPASDSGPCASTANRT